MFAFLPSRYWLLLTEAINGILNMGLKIRSHSANTEQMKKGFENGIAVEIIRYWEVRVVVLPNVKDTSIGSSAHYWSDTHIFMILLIVRIFCDSMIPFQMLLL